MTIKNWPKAQRPRERLLTLGAASLSDAQLLAILLRVGTQGCNALDLAQGLINHFGSLSQVFTANQSDLLAYKGMGEATFCQFAVVLEVGKRVLLQQQQSQQIQTPNDLLPLFAQFLVDETVEVLLAAFLNSDNRLIRLAQISQGSLSHHTVYVRELAKQALACHAAAVVLAHNHPSGNVHVSAEDVASTKVLQDALALLDIVLLDHLVIAHQQWQSVMYN